MAIITAELDLERRYRDGQAERQFYELHEMVPCELIRYNARMVIEEVYPARAHKHILLYNTFLFVWNLPCIGN